MTDQFVSILALGGTIASQPGQRDSALVQPELTASDLAALMGETTDIPPLKCESLLQLPSGDLGFATLAKVAERVRAVIAEGARGVVITQGTDTLEETAFQLDLLLDVTQPVVLTGAMRNPSLPGADGAANLLAAIRVAAASEAASLGVMVVMNDEVHAARFVRKAHTHKPSAFSSPAAGPLGWIAEGRVRIVLRPAERSATLAWRGEPPDVALVTMGFSATVTELDRFSRDPPAGMVIAGFGGGHVPSWTVEKIGALAAEIPVVLASRIGVGEGLTGTYGYPGSETDLLRRGCIAGGYLDAMKARVLLSLLLGDRADRNRIVQAFSRY